MIKNLALEASAGSGKTFALSVRYISLLFLRAKPNQILTLTFTNKAALEMKTRIFETLKNLENSEELYHICEITKKSKDEILILKPKVLASFLKGDLKISTIDSFFSSILRKFSFNIGLMPDFALKESVVDEDLQERFLKICKKSMLYNSLILFSLNEKRKLGDIFSLLTTLFDKHSEIDFEMFAKESHAYPDQSKVLEIVDEIRDRFVKNGLGEKALNTLNITSVKELLEKKFLAKDDFSYWSYKKCVDDQINSLHVELKKELYIFIRAKESYLISQIAKLYKTFCKAMDIESKQSSTLSFSAMTNRLFDILKDEISKDFLYFRLDGSFNHLLVDEFQDTSIVQYKILEPFMEEIVAGIGVKEDRTLFLVGDTKQSIYRFRGGSKELFSYAAKSLNLDLGVLGTNYRSSCSVVNFINDTFADKIKGYKKQAIKKDAVQGSASVLVGDNLQNILIEELRKLLDMGVSQSEIAILCYTNQEALMLKELIEDTIKGAKASLEAKRRVIDVPIISGIIDFMHYLYFGDKIYLENFSILTGEKFEDSKHIFNLNKSVDALAMEIIKYFGISDSREDLLLFIESCGRFRDIEEFLFNYKDISTNSISRDSEGIKVLTIHKSKGLEFSNVFVVDRLKRATRGGGTFIFDYDDILLKNIYLKVKNREFFDKEYEEAKIKESQKEYEDALNTQYVAFTRAKENLFVLSKDKGSSFENLGLIESKTGTICVKEKKECKQTGEIKLFMPAKYGSQEVEKSEKDDNVSSDFMAIEFGLALHYMLEMMGGFEMKYIENAYESLKNRYARVLDESDLKDIKKRVIRLLENSEFNEIIKDAKLSREQPLYYKKERKQLDLLVEREDSVVVIDYKSSEHLQSSHVKQVTIYKNALREIYGRDCEAYLCYLKQEKNEIIKV